MSTTLQNDTLPEIDGIEQLQEPTEGSRPFTTVYYRDQADKLTKDATALPVRSNHFIAPAIGWPKRIYRRSDQVAKVATIALETLKHMQGGKK